jgi:ATP adenylyltransferase
VTDRLWAPWRMEYIKDSVQVRPTTCIFCDLIAPGVDDRRRLVLHRAERTIVLMNKFPYNNGHLLVMPKAHTGRLDTLDEPTFAELHDTLRRAVKVLEIALEPHGINLGMNLGPEAGAGIPDHIHYHLVPRWTGDTNFMPIIAETKVISQHILATYDELKPHFS